MNSRYSGLHRDIRVKSVCYWSPLSFSLLLLFLHGLLLYLNTQSYMNKYQTTLWVGDLRIQQSSHSKAFKLAVKLECKASTLRMCGWVCASMRVCVCLCDCSFTLISIRFLFVFAVLLSIVQLTKLRSFSLSVCVSECVFVCAFCDYVCVHGFAVDAVGVGKKF